MNEEYQRGHYEYTPFYAKDERGRMHPLFIPAFAVMPSSMPGYKAGNSLIDENNRRNRIYEAEQRAVPIKIPELKRRRANKKDK